jgi:hypothetical protein
MFGGDSSTSGEGYRKARLPLEMRLIEVTNVCDEVTLETEIHAKDDKG